MDDRQLLRYSRHLLLGEMGHDAQERLTHGDFGIVGGQLPGVLDVGRVSQAGQ